jgi:lipopolysaccharide/colanic/teichoic acid biosynthesis glycosyltransferase
MLNWGNARPLQDAPAAFEVFHRPSALERVPLHFQSLVKRILDLAIAVPLLLVSLPLFAVIALWIRRTSSGPAWFHQQRIGYLGRPFTLLKFRTMSSGDDAVHRAYVRQWMHEGKHAQQPHGYFKLADDPRITRVGRFLRRYSLDELPQLINVVRGEMSLVGPRPALPYEVADYEPWQRERLQVRPGLTGLWQVSGRNRLSFDRMVKLDVLYIRTQSTFGDLSILMKTASVVLQGTGH